LKHLTYPLKADAAVSEKNSTPVDATELKQLLQRFEGKKSRVAAHLGIDRTTLWRWLKKHQIR
jgi:transcriptional regulator of acetoin/glycerol metabolism